MTIMNDVELTILLRERVAAVRANIDWACAKAGRRIEDITLVAVTKTVSPRVIRLLNEPDCAFWPKAAELPGIRWHFIGHLQRNKLEKTLPSVHLLHSADSERLLAAVNEFGMKSGKAVRLLLEVNCSREPQKGGIAPEELPRLAALLPGWPGIDCRGLMTMAAYSDDPETSRRTFAELRGLREDLQRRTAREMPELSMGMSNDYAVAVEEGATLVRIGTALFDGLEAE
jgi:PLP dependent protein